MESQLHRVLKAEMVVCIHIKQKQIVSHLHESKSSTILFNNYKFNTANTTLMIICYIKIYLTRMNFQTQLNRSVHKNIGMNIPIL